MWQASRELGCESWRADALYAGVKVGGEHPFESDQANSTTAKGDLVLSSEITTNTVTEVTALSADGTLTNTVTTVDAKTAT